MAEHEPVCAYILGLLTIPAALVALLVCAAIVRGAYLLFGGVLRVGVIRFGMQSHEPILRLLQREPGDFRSVLFSRGRFAVIAIADVQRKRGGLSGEVGA